MNTEGKMKLLIISDGHGDTSRLEKLSGIAENMDAVIFAGDFAEFKKPETGKPFLERLVKLHDCVFSVTGNCDEPDFLQELENFDICVQGSLAYFKGLSFIGSGGGSKFTGTTPNERTDEELVSDLSIIPSSSGHDHDQEWNNLIVITHNPPEGTKLDQIPAGAHVGSPEIRKFIETHRPLLAVSGHIHESRALDELGRTKLVNPGALADGYYAVAEISFPDGKTAEVTSLELFSL